MSTKRLITAISFALALLATACGSTASNGDSGVQSVSEEITDPLAELDLVEVPARLLADDVASGEPGSARLVDGFSDFNAAVGEVEIEEDGTFEVLFEFVVPESGSCSLGPFEALEFDQNSRVIFPTFEEVERDGACTADENPHLVMVGVLRNDLPDGAFSVSVSPAGFYPLVEFDAGELKAAGPGDTEFEVLGDPAIVEVGATGLLRNYTTHCDTQYLWWQVNGQNWQNAEPGPSSIPSDWRDVERGELVDLIITLEAPDLISAVAFGAETVVMFEPADTANGCD